MKIYSDGFLPLADAPEKYRALKNFEDILTYIEMNQIPSGTGQPYPIEDFKIEEGFEVLNWVRGNTNGAWG